jgi:two-component system phosphate regulon sensor histidine kinase PhoR
MIKRSIAVVIVLAVISLGLITAGQVYWVTQAYHLQESVFVTKVNSVLINVANKIHLIENDQSIVEPPKAMERGVFIISVNHTPSPYLLKTLLEDELQMQGVMEEVQYGIYDCFSNQYEVEGWLSIVSDSVSHDDSKNGLKVYPSEGHYLSLYFPHKNTFLFKRIDFWMYSSVVIFLIFVFFAYTIWVLFREKRLSTVRNDFVNNMTHELKTPLATIQLGTEALKSDKIFEDKERHKTYVEIIESEAKRLKGQLEKVLQLSSLSQRKSLVWQRVDLHEIIQTAVITNAIRIEDLGGNILMDLSAESHVVTGDPVHISNIIYNLLDNAIKYTDQEPLIQIRTRNGKNCILVDIEDNGIGINRRQQSLIFDKFYRVPTGDIHNVKGFGLGLYYVQTTLKAQKGKISVKSEKGKGSIFTLQLPLANK